MLYNFLDFHGQLQNCVLSNVFGLVGHVLLGYHFPTFCQKLCSAFSRVIDYLTDTENWAPHLGSA